jgi:plasmid stabilization system protein ParE
VKARKLPVVWSSVAERDLAEIAMHVHRDSPSAAQRFLRRVEERGASLGTLAHRGRIVPELLSLEIRTYRELIVPPHRLIYRVEGDRVLVLAVLDSRRDLEDLLLRRLLFEEDSFEEDEP